MLKVVTVLCVFGFALGQRPLEEYNVALNTVSVSGVSSGAAMATQFHVAYSQFVRGVGLFAGVPYYCAKGSSLIATSCMNNPANVNVNDLIAQANSYASEGRISATHNLSGDKVFIFHGDLDSVVLPRSATNIRQFYANFGADIADELTLQAEHCQPTVDYGLDCDQRGGDYINRCDYDGAFHMLNHIYGGLTQPSGSVPLDGDFYVFDQSEFFYVSPPALSHMDTQGFVYVPSNCVSGAACRLHVVYHGCSQNRQDLGDIFATKTGYNEVGELNDIIMLYPQTIKGVPNPYGCWDWWSYNVYNHYATQNAHQILAVCRMIQKVTGASVPCPNEPDM
jgi:poly(3-hydroxybutyrate) depolymerase